LKVAFFGIAAKNINGMTLHEAFQLRGLNFNRKYEPLQLSQLRNLQKRFEFVKLLIIDEFSVITGALLHFIEQRCHEIWPGNSNKLFAGIDVLLAGDIYQLPPINVSSSLCWQQLTNNFHDTGRAIFNEITNIFILHDNMRADLTDPNSMAWEALLHNLRLNQMTKCDFLLLNSRVANESVISSEYWDSSVHLFPTNKSANIRNNEKLNSLQGSLLRILSSIQPKNSRKPASNQPNAFQLIKQYVLRYCPNDYRPQIQQPFLDVKIGAKMILTSNLSTECGLSKGTMVTVMSIWMHPNHPFPCFNRLLTNETSMLEYNSEQMPIIMVKVESDYNGPTFHERCIPIAPIEHSLSIANMTFKIHSYPLRLAYGLTIHSVQGLTLDRIVIDTSAKSFFAFAMAYVAVSRTRSINSLLLRKPIDELGGEGSFRKMVDMQMSMFEDKFSDTRLRWNLC
jgi:hypothetical protein